MKVDNLQIPQGPEKFFSWLKNTSEKYWDNIKIKKGICGFQTQKQTKWLKGLNRKEIKAYETELGFCFPDIYKFYLRNMNGTDKPAINVYAGCEPAVFAANYYSFLRDLEIVKDNIKWIYEEFSVNEERVRQERIPHIIPIVGHRFLVADNCIENPVLSMYGQDSILYAPNLESFLVADIFQNGSRIQTDTELPVKFWINENL